MTSPNSDYPGKSTHLIPVMTHWIILRVFITFNVISGLPEINSDSSNLTEETQENPNYIRIEIRENNADRLSSFEY